MHRLEAELYKLDKQDFLLVMNKIKFNNCYEFYHILTNLNDDLLDFIGQLDYGCLLIFHNYYVRVVCYENEGVPKYHYDVTLDNQMFKFLYEQFENKSISREDLLMLNGIEQ